MPFTFRFFSLFVPRSVFYYFFFLYYYFFLRIQSCSVLVTNLFTIIESSHSMNYSLFCLICTVQHTKFNYLCVIVLFDLKTIVTLFVDFGPICPALGINLKSQWNAQLNLIDNPPLFRNENVILFYSPIMQSSKFTLSYYS